MWQGQLSLPGGALGLTVSVIALTGGQYFAALDVPMQKLSRVPAELQLVPGTDSVRVLLPQLGSRLLARLDSGNLLLRGTWTQPGLHTSLVLRHAPLPAAASTVTSLSRPYREEKVIFSNFAARLRLAGSLTVPAGAGPFPAVVLLSDLGAQDRDGRPADQSEPTTYPLLSLLADYLTRHGIAVLRLDDRGMGQSEGHNATTTTTQRVGDAQAALNYLRTRPEVDLLHLGLIGHGEGANVALLAAAQPLPPAFVVSLAGYGQPGLATLLTQQAAALRALKLSPSELAIRLRRQATLAELVRYSTNLGQTQAMVANLLRQDEPSLLPEVAQLRAAAHLMPWHRAFLTFDPLAGLQAVQVPVLLLSGLADEQAPPAEHQAVLEKELRASGNRTVSSQRLPGVNHWLQPPPTQWIVLDGEPRPIVAPALLETLRLWLVAQARN
ncbi:alpha/beta fold hydrolase [Hymenobacter setariae]|uniref:Alpha/beta fold hydrolase n=1 Tax=Hymenobacter setariae TaxID=2594794 RepID=A0A558BVM0_9BACT|nr:alpha/beta fold hydrolase [Hymenobacter setariae]TVT40564.1 alpha/beta fold hydrolase [Hymenobacter setariae]